MTNKKLTNKQLTIVEKEERREKRKEKVEKRKKKVQLRTGNEVTDQTEVIS